MLKPTGSRVITWPADHRPMLVVVLDTEAEFRLEIVGLAPRRRRDFGEGLAAGAADF